MAPLFSLILLSTAGALLLACIFFIALAFNAPRKAFRITLVFISGAVFAELLTLGIYAMFFPPTPEQTAHVNLYLGAMAITPLLGGGLMLRFARKRRLLES